ncbi:MAG: zinc ribbon domain-containing protein [Gammaproteobacteria bacterium]|nr:zinc ribbon domain-containing protein [Gammaproteobacteria bacterium]
MPIYEYQCSKCGHRLEALQKMSDDLLTDCPDCGESALTKLVSAAGFVLKGTGWYVTDFRDKGKGGAGEKKSADKGEGSETKSDSKGESKTETKGEAGTETKSGAKPDTKDSSKSTTAASSASKSDSSTH